MALVEVSMDGRYAPSLSLESGATYVLCAFGTGKIEVSGDGLGDAEYADFSNPPGSVVDGCGRTGSEVDVGIAIAGVTVNRTEPPLWGDFNPAHVYTVSVEGKGEPISFGYRDCDFSYGSPNTGSISVMISKVGQ